MNRKEKGLFGLGPDQGRLASEIVAYTRLLDHTLAAQILQGAGMMDKKNSFSEMIRSDAPSEKED